MFGEGAGAVVLKRHSDAIRDGDRIYCLLRGMSQRSADPNPREPQAEHYRQCLDEALCDSGLDSIRLGLVELGGVQGQSASCTAGVENRLGEIGNECSSNFMQQ